MLRSSRLPFIALAFASIVPRSAASSPAPSCALADLTLSRFPLDGFAGHDWVITNYVDLDPARPGVADYTGTRGALARTYDGHTGVDVDIPSFREMDAGAAVIYAAAPGTVDEIVDDQPDRNQRCAGRWNVVAVRHDNGFRVLYGHIKARSALVGVGQRIGAGTPLAIVGSAGCSPQAHLHFEVRDCAGTPVETLRDPTPWTTPPAHDIASDVMDMMLRAGPMASVANIKDPAPDATAIPAGATLGIGLSAAVRGGDRVAIALVPPRAAPATTRTLTIARDARFGHWYLGFTVAAGTAPGTWAIEVRINGKLRARRFIAVTAPRPPAPPAPGVSRRPAIARAAAGSRRSSKGRAGASRTRTDRSRPAF